ncbi:MAG: hypothetical protein WAQ98_05595 [Blastocatellia bacterium]
MKTITQKIYAVILIGVILCYSSATIYGQKPQQEELSDAQKTLQEMGIEYTRNAFQKAVFTGDVDVVKLFIDSQLNFEANVFSNEFNKEVLIKEVTYNAVSKGQIAIVGLLLDSFPNNIFLEQEVEKGLIKAALSLGNISLLKILLDRSIGTNYIKNNSLQSFTTNDKAVIKLLEQRGLISIKNKEEFDRELKIALNEQHAIEAMRLFHSVQATYQAGVGIGNFGSAEEIFKNSLIDGALANAAGVGPMEAEGIKCIGDGTAKDGYNFLVFKKDADQGNLADFVVIAIPIIAQGNDRTGNRSFYVDATSIIRMCNANETPSENSSPVGD